MHKNALSKYIKSPNLKPQLAKERTRMRIKIREGYYSNIMGDKLLLNFGAKFQR